MKIRLRGLASIPFFWEGVLALVLAGVYVRTLLPGIGISGDTAELQFVGKVLGISHPTGYPSYLLLNHFFVQVFPVGTLAYKANLLSALFTIAAGLFLFHILIQLGCRKPVALVTSMAFGFTRTLWAESTVAEVYTLNILFVSAVVYFFLRWSKTRENRSFLFGCASYAMSFGNHLTMITLLPAIAFMVWTADRRVLIDRKRLAWIALFMSLGASQYLYVVWRFNDMQTAYLSEQVANIGQFVSYVTGGEFRHLMFSFSITQVISERIPMFGQLLLREYLVLLPLAGVGFYYLRSKRVNSFLLLAFVGTTAYAINYRIPDVATYFIPAYFVVAIYLGAGLELMLDKVFQNRVWLGGAFLVLVPLALVVTNYGEADQHSNTRVATEVEGYLQTVKQDALIISPFWHYSEYFAYYLVGEGRQSSHIYVTRYNSDSTERFRAYISGKKPLYLPELRIDVPPGLTVYWIGEKQRDELEEDGFKLSKVGKNLFRVSL
ncbi:MAG: DUF2723 domain-containing protein [Chloroflexi bacterium]|nr:DUF2723 domain-containing protein [Chloroflexota bacterium]